MIQRAGLEGLRRHFTVRQARASRLAILPSTTMDGFGYGSYDHGSLREDSTLPPTPYPSVPACNTRHADSTLPPPFPSNPAASPPSQTDRPLLPEYQR